MNDNASQAMTAVDVGILGAFELRVGGQPVAVTAFKQRALLARLAVSANRVLSRDLLIDGLWHGSELGQPANALQSYVSLLRGLLEPDRGPREPARVLRTHPPGYQLAIDPAAVDAVRFEQLAGDGGRALRGDAATAREHLTAALALWRGRALEEFADLPWARERAGYLEHLRLQALEDRIAADLALGEHAAVIEELEQLVAREELRERPWRLLMLALYRSGRQAEALACYGRCREALIRVGLKPSPALRRLEGDILDQSPSLDLPAAPRPLVARRSAAPSPTSNPAASHVPLIGRGEPLGVLHRAWESALNGRGRVVLIGGDAGIGKTRLAEELAGRARENACVAWGRCDESSSAPALWPWTRVLRAVADADVQSDIRDALARAGFAVSDLAPLITEWALADGAATVEPGDAGAARFRLCQAASYAMLACAARRPLLIVLDDIQWADATSLQLLDVLAQSMAASALLVIATFRDPYGGPGDPLTGTLAKLARQPLAERSSLAGLDVGEVTQLVAAHTGEPAADVVVSALHRLTRGNPFLVSQLVAQGVLDDLASGTRWEVPAAVRDVVRRGLDGLAAAVGDLLSVAAVLGSDFSLPDLEHAAGLSNDELLDAIDIALASGMVVEDRESIGCRFAHPLIRETIYEDLPGGRRARIHRRVAEAIEELHCHDEDYVSVLAHHFYEGVIAGAADKAFAYALRAADDAARRLAHEHAERQLRNALLILSHLGRRSDRFKRELDVQTRLVDVLISTKGYGAPEVRVAAERAHALSRDAGVGEQLLASMFRVSISQCVRGEFGGAQRTGEQMLQAGRAGHEPPLALGGHAALGVVALHRGDTGRALEHLEQVATLAGSLSDPWALTHPPELLWRFFSAMALELRGDAGSARTRIDEALALAQAKGRTQDEASALGFGALTAALSGEFQLAAGRAEEAAAMSQRHHFELWRAMTTSIHGWALAKQRRGNGVVALVDGIAAMQRTGARMMGHFLHALLADAYLSAGDPEAARGATDAGLAVVHATGERFYEAELHRLHGEILLTLSADHGDQAKALFLHAIEVAERQHARPQLERARASLSRLDA